MSWVKQSDENHPPETGEWLPICGGSPKGGPSVGRLDRKVVLVEFDAATPSNMLFHNGHSGVEITFAGVGVSKHDMCVGRNHKGASYIPSGFLTHRRDEYGFAFLGKAVSNDSFHGGHGQVIQNLNIFGSEVANDHLSSHQISLSVDGAGVGTTESTEGDQTPDDGETKKHPAAVTAGCDETKTNGKQGSDFNV